MRLLASTDIALRLLMRLAAEPGRVRTAEELSAEVGAPRNHLHKIIQDLAGAGLARTLRGARGGVLLARPAAEIRIGEVVRLLEEGQALVECFRPDGGACCLSADCRLRGVLARGRAAFLAELDAATLADCLPGSLVGLRSLYVVGDSPS
ncbi:RrF2 family transcriptional regulator [Belnapia arida]|nr:Rrf2 family transcriptional regulator [Belnapia arida]